jgi:GH25 family lysozyme M1 (1,4-beta-N-acetylmuramidase)
MARGIDIYAAYQRVTDWNALRNHVSFMYVKLTDGGGRATTDSSHLVAGAKSVGIPVGGYHYAQFSPSPEAQANVFIDWVKRTRATDLVPMLDLEAPFTPNGTARDFGIRFCRRVAALGFKPGVYMSDSFARGVRPDQWDTNPVIWIARYGAKPAYGGRYDIHQYSSSGQVPGIAASGVDMNESYTNNHFLKAGDADMPLNNDDKASIDAIVREAIYGRSGSWYNPRFRNNENYAQVIHAIAADAAATRQLMLTSSSASAQEIAEALKPGLASAVLPLVQDAVRQALGSDNAAQADEISNRVVDLLGQRIVNPTA